MNVKPTKRAVAKHLREGAKVIETYGWNQCSYGNEESGFCALGALNYEGMGLKNGDGMDILDCYLTLKLKNKFPGGSIISFNDTEGRTKEEVLKAFRTIARELEHGGVL